MSKKNYSYEGRIKISTNPVRWAASKQEFIDNLVEEYNDVCSELFDIYPIDIEVTDSDNPEDEEEQSNE